MYLGRMVEIGDREAIFQNPSHPYTKALMKAVPVADPYKRNKIDDLKFKPISSPIHPLDYRPDPSTYTKVKSGHFVLQNELGYS